MTSSIAETISSILLPDEESAAQASRRQDRLTKPKGSLGKLEELSIRCAGILRDPVPRVSSPSIVVACADHGVAAEGVSAFPQAVTEQMVRNFLDGGAAINVLGRFIGARVVVVNAGIAADIGADERIVNRPIAAGTKNIAKGPAMTREQAIAAIELGIEIAGLEKSKGATLVGTGEMGIANTTSAAAVAAVLSGLASRALVGRGTGIDDVVLERKIAIVASAIDRNMPDPSDGLDVLEKVGGFEIGCLAGLILGAASRQMVVVIDGYISTAAAMIAARLAPMVRRYLIAAHLSAEGGHAAMLEWLGLSPLLRLDLRLGEGSGAALAIGLVDAACRLLREMATFEQAGVAGKEVGP